MSIDVAYTRQMFANAIGGVSEWPHLFMDTSTNTIFQVVEVRPNLRRIG